MEINSHDERLLDVAAAAEYLGYAEGTVRNKVSRNEIPYIKLGRTVRFRKAALDRWMTEHAVTQDSAA